MFFRSVARLPGFPLSRFSRISPTATPKTTAPVRCVASLGRSRRPVSDRACVLLTKSRPGRWYDGWFLVEKLVRPALFCIVASRCGTSWQTVMIEVRARCVSAQWPILWVGDDLRGMVTYSPLHMKMNTAIFPSVLSIPLCQIQ